MIVFRGNGLPIMYAIIFAKNSIHFLRLFLTLEHYYQKKPLSSGGVNVKIFAMSEQYSLKYESVRTELYKF